MIQSEILNSNCTVGCHVQGSSFAEQSDLVLTSDVAYDQLVNVLPHNPSALSDGLLRVGTEGLSSLYSSFLWEKINAPDQEHFLIDHPYYGAIMPLGMPYLTNGELAFIKEWILGGAPEEGEVADTLLLQDTTRFEPPEFEIPAPPENGMQFHIGPFEISSGDEREFFYYMPVESEDDILINRMEIIMRPGSHHFIAYTFQMSMPEMLYPNPYEYRDIRDEEGNYIQENMIQMAFHEFGAGTQWPRMDYHLPPGIALRLDPNLGFDMNSHYVNVSDTTMIGEVYLNLHTSHPSDVEKEANILMMNNTDINLPPNQITTLIKTFWIGDMFPEPISVFQLFSHAHQHMLEFRVYIEGGEEDGELVYVAYDWEHPPILELDPPLYLELNQGLTVEATYDNWTDETLEFGFLSTDEMMILFGYYYLGESPSAISLHIHDGWNLVGLPFEMVNTTVETVFPGAIPETLFQFNGVYNYVENMEPGNGYWLYFTESEDEILFGTPISTNEIELTEGWNLISGISETIPISSIIDPQGIIIPGTIYGFDDTYVLSEILSPGKGYWIYTSQDGSILLSVDNTLQRRTQFFNPENLNSISLGKLSLYFGNQVSELDLQKFELPPKPPTGGKDIRFSNDTKLCSLDECMIEVRTDGGPLNIVCDIKEDENWEIINKWGSVFKCEGVQVLEVDGESETFVLRKSTSPKVQTEFSLFPAHPNPFNPKTEIQISLPKQVFINVAIFNTLGQKVELLKKDELNAGIHTLTWDGSTQPSGIYFVVVRIENERYSRKIVLLK